MPKNTQMHMQWITVNGQSVPLVLPQYWDGEKWVVSSEQNPLPVKAELTGSNVADGIPVKNVGKNIVNVLPRAVRNSNNTNNIIAVPYGVRGVVIELRVHGVTGAFNSEQGISMQTFGRTSIDGGVSNYFTPETKKTSNPLAQHYNFMHPDFKQEEYATLGNTQIVGVAVIPPLNIRIDLRIDGTFNQGEGFDCQVNAIFTF